MARKFIEFYAASPNAFGNVLKAKAGDTTSAMFWGEKGQAFLHQISKRFIDTVQEVGKDDHLTPVGRADAIKAKAKTLLAELRRENKKFLNPLVQKFQNFDSTNLRAVTPARDPIQAVERMELRSYLRGLDGGNRLAVFNAALRENDEQVLAAFFEKSSLYQFLGAEILSAGRREYMRRNGGGDTLDAEEAGAVLVDNIKHVADGLTPYAGASEDAEKIYEELPKLNWQFTPTQDTLAMRNFHLSSNLPDIELEPMGDGQRIESPKKDGKKM